VEIDRDIPPPPKVYGRPQKWPVHKLKIDESVFCDSANEAFSVRHQIRKLGGKSVMRKQFGGYRIWRVA
jgi:hypothetical protein